MGESVETKAAWARLKSAWRELMDEVAAWREVRRKIRAMNMVLRAHQIHPGALDPYRDEVIRQVIPILARLQHKEEDR